MAITKKYTIEIDGQQATATVGQLKGEITRLEDALDNIELGSLDADKLIAELGKAKAALKDLDEAVDVTFDKDRAGAYVDAINGIAGAYGIALVAAQNFGLSEKDVQKYQARLQEVLTVVASLEQIQRLTTSEVRTSLKLLVGDTVGYIKTIFAQGQAYLFSGTAATGAGKAARLALLATGLGAFVVLIGAVIANWDKVKQVTSGWAATFKPEIEALSGFIDAFIARARDVASFLTGGLIDDAKTAEKVALVAHQKEMDVLANEALARRIAELEAAGKDTFALRRELAIRELNALKQETEEEKKIYLNKSSELRVLENTEAKKRADEAEKNRKEQEQKDKAAAEKAKAEREKRLNEEFAAFQKRNQAVEKLDKLSAQDRLQLDIEAEQKRLEELNKLASRAVKQEVQNVAQEARQTDFGDSVLVRVFGVGADQLDKLKEGLNTSLGSLKDLAVGFAGTLLSESLSAVDAQITATQDRLAEITAQLAQSQADAKQTEDALANSTGAKRDFLLQKISKERAEVERLAVAKKKAADEEQKQLAERANLEKKQQQLLAATTLATTVATAAAAVSAGVKAISGAAAIPFPGSLPAIIAAIAAVGGAVAAARGLGNTFEQGGLVSGPRHSQGGIQMWHKSGAHLGEMEGGEYVINRAATANNRPLLDMINEAGRTRALPPPSGYFANGGLVPGGGSLPAGSVVVKEADLSALLDTNRAMLAQLSTIRSYGPARLNIGPGEAQQIEEQKQVAVLAQAAAEL